MKKKILFRILLNTRFRDIKSANRKWMSTSKDESWLAYRIHIFMKYTAQSLKNQSDQEFKAIVLYLDSTEGMVRRMISEYEELPDNIIFLNQKDEEAFMKEYLKDADYLYEVRLDSDDCYIESFVKDLRKVEITEETECILSKWGYIWDHHTKRLGKVYYASPPFYTLLYKVKEYKDGFRYSLKGGHVGACRLNCYILQSEQYLFVLHDSNILANFDQRKQQVEFTDSKEKREILRKFGVVI